MCRNVAKLWFLALLLSSPLRADQNCKCDVYPWPPECKDVCFKATGTVVSSTEKELILSQKVDDKTTQIKFVLRPETKKDLTPEQGKKLTVYYRVDKGQNIATRVLAAEESKNKATPKSAAKLMGSAG